MKTLTDGQMAKLEKTRPLADSSGFYGNVYINGQSLGEAMLQAGYCIVNPQMNKKGFHREGPNMLKLKGPEGAQRLKSPDGFLDMNAGPPPMMPGGGQPFGRQERSGMQQGARKIGGPPMGQGPQGHQGPGGPNNMGRQPNLSTLMSQPPPNFNPQPNMGFPHKIT